MKVKVKRKKVKTWNGMPRAVDVVDCFYIFTFTFLLIPPGVHADGGD